MRTADESWYRVEEVQELPSPALLIYPDRVEENLERMLRTVGDVQCLRPHVKTNKMPEILRLMRARGITRFKCATIAETEMCAREGAPDVLLAYQPVGPAPHRLAALTRQFPTTKFSVIVDDPEVLSRLDRAAGESGRPWEVLVDIDCGQHRTGIEPDQRAVELYRQLQACSRLQPGGLHVYDGHLNDADAALRARKCEDSFAPAAALAKVLTEKGWPVPHIVAGGTPTFPFHARRQGVECSPGTCVFWDAGYSSKLKDLDYLHAAMVLTRVTSKPTSKRLCLDLGHKAIASENPHPRVIFPQLADARSVGHSEEHLVVETDQADQFRVGDCLYGIPWHICPTVALHAEAYAIQNHRLAGVWKVTARERRLTV